MGRPRTEHRFIDGAELKQCGACKVWFPLSSFSSDPSKWDGLQYRHRECARKATARSRGGQPARPRSVSRGGQYSVVVWGSKSAARVAWRRDHPGRDAAARKRSDGKNRDVIRARDRERRPHGCPKVKEANRRRYQADPAKVISQVSRWRVNNPEQAAVNGRLASARRRARLRGLPVVPWTEQQVIERDGLACWMCRAAFGGGAASGRREWAIDHLIPISIDYKDHPGDTLANLAIACHPCNIAKGAKLLPAAVSRYRANRRCSNNGKELKNGHVKPAS